MTEQKRQLKCIIYFPQETESADANKNQVA